MSKGRAYVNGFSLTKQLSAVRKELGYCPQFDPLLDLMTSREQLSLYARIHGISEKSIPAIVQQMLNTLGLSRFADKQCGSYSGGNKRKLSLAIALIGNPSVVFLSVSTSRAATRAWSGRRARSLIGCSLFLLLVLPCCC